MHTETRWDYPSGKSGQVSQTVDAMIGGSTIEEQANLSDIIEQALVVNAIAAGVLNEAQCLCGDFKGLNHPGSGDAGEQPAPPTDKFEQLRYTLSDIQSALEETQRNIANARHRLS